MTVFVSACVYFPRSQVNSNYLFLAFSIAMCGDNKYVVIETAIELYLNSDFYSKLSSFISLISKHAKVFSSIDTILAISVSHNAFDSNKTKGVGSK